MNEDANSNSNNISGSMSSASPLHSFNNRGEENDEAFRRGCNRDDGMSELESTNDP